jgi:hypothetical protein
VLEQDQVAASSRKVRAEQAVEQDHGHGGRDHGRGRARWRWSVTTTRRWATHERHPGRAGRATVTRKFTALDRDAQRDERQQERLLAPHTLSGG